MSALISCAAAALRPARLRTSEATTANPRPCSPARAASTAAFRARMLVWKAMLSITPMMSPILCELSEMPRMVDTTSDTTLPPSAATLLASVAMRLAMDAFCALWLTVALSSSMDAACCCKALACDSVRSLRSRLPWAISALAADSWAALLSTCLTMATNSVCMVASARFRSASSSWPWVFTCPVRSPFAT